MTTPTLLRRTGSLLAPVLHDNRGRVLMALACLLAAKGGLLVIPFLLKSLVDGLDNLSTGTTWVLGLVLAYGAARFANTLFGEIRDTLFGRVTERVLRVVGLQVFEHVHSLDLAYHLERRTGGLARDIERGLQGISFLMRFFIFNIAPTLFEIGMVASILLVNYGPRYALVVLASVVAYAGFSFRATSWRTRFVRAANEADSASNSRAVDSLLNYETVKYFNNEQFEAGRYDDALAVWESARRSNRLSLFALNGGQAAIIALAQTSMLGMAALDVRSGVMSLGDFVLINQFMLQLFLPLGFLGFVYREIKASLANIEHLFAMLAEQPKITDPADPQYLPDGPRELRFEQIGFAYQPERPVFDDLSFLVEPGKTVAIVGASGAGKSTLVKLLFRFYDADQGRITIDGIDTRALPLDVLRRNIAIVPQDCVLFNDTLGNNIRYGRPDARDDEVMHAVKTAHLEAFVAQLPQGLETTVGERGLKLSGGEKQRVAIARAVLKRAPILVFDEATSSLDSHAERAVMAAFSELAHDYTALVIAHRLSTIVSADHIIVVADGQVAESGTHQALLAQNGQYAALWRAQSEHTSVPENYG